MFGFFKRHARRNLIGVVVVAFRCDGCMATDHNFMWAGTIEGFEPDRGEYVDARVKIHKRNDDHRNSRDLNLGCEILCIQDAYFQRITDNFYLYYK